MPMIKTLMRWMLAAALSVCLLLAAASAAETDSFTFSLNAAGTGYVVTGYTGSASDVTVPDWYDGKPVTAIGAGAFMGNSGVTRVALPSSITSIGASAFKNCSALTMLTTYQADAEPPVSRLPGDANDDGRVNIYDALAVIKYLDDSAQTINTSNADVNGDGVADFHDALKIMQREAGWRVTLQ